MSEQNFIVYTDHIFFIFLSVGGNPDWFYNFPILNSTALDMDI